jgi:hypothetical protein
MRRAVLAVSLFLALAAHAGCAPSQQSGNNFQGAEKDVANVLTDLRQAARDDDPKKVCADLLAKALVQKAGDCQTAVGLAFDDSDSVELDVDSVRITGDTARARVKTGADQDRTELIRLTKENGVWRISQFAGEVK